MINKPQKPSHDPHFRKILVGLSERLAYLRAAKNESMEKVAQACGITRGTVFKTEHPQEDEDLSLATVWSIARHHGLSLEAIFQGLEDRPKDDAAELLGKAKAIDRIDELAFSLVDEMKSLQIRADVAEEACLNATSDKQLENLSKHSAKLRQKRYQLILEQRERITE